jgi:hypothetical protein
MLRSIWIVEGDSASKSACSCVLMPDSNVSNVEPRAIKGTRITCARGRKTAKLI